MMTTRLISLLITVAALPKEWPGGFVKGLRARGGFEVDVAWQDGKLAGVVLRSQLGKDCTVRYGDKTIALKTERGKVTSLDTQLTAKP